MCHVSLLGDRGCPHENVEEQEQGRYLERERDGWNLEFPGSEFWYIFLNINIYIGSMGRTVYIPTMNG